MGRERHVAGGERRRADLKAAVADSMSGELRMAEQTAMAQRPGGAGGGDGGGAVEGDAADGDEGKGDGGGGTNVFEADAFGVAFGGGGVDGADADVVDAGGEGGARLVEGVGGETDDLPGFEHPPGGGGGKIGLAEMDAVGVEEAREVGAVVDDEADAGLCRHVAESAAEVEDLRVAHPLLAELDDVGAAADDLLRGVEDGDAAVLLREEDVEPHGCEPGVRHCGLAWDDVREDRERLPSPRRTRRTEDDGRGHRQRQSQPGVR